MEVNARNLAKQQKDQAKRNENDKEKRERQKIWRKKHTTATKELLRAIAEKNRSMKASNARDAARDKLIGKKVSMQDHAMNIWGMFGFEPVTKEGVLKTVRDKWDDLFDMAGNAMQVDRDVCRSLIDYLCEGFHEEEKKAREGKRGNKPKDREPLDMPKLVSYLTHIHVDKILAVLQEESAAMAVLQAKGTLSKSEQCTLDALRTQEPVLVAVANKKKEIDAKRAAGDNAFIIMDNFYRMFDLFYDLKGIVFFSIYLLVQHTHTNTFYK